jgi:hypothetical protein
MRLWDLVVQIGRYGAHVPGRFLGAMDNYADIGRSRKRKLGLSGRLWQKDLEEGKQKGGHLEYFVRNPDGRRLASTLDDSSLFLSHATWFKRK